MRSRLIQALRGSGADDPALVSRLLGVLLVCGGALTVLVTLATPPPAGNPAGIHAVGIGGLGVGVVCIAAAPAMRNRAVHVAFACGTGLIALGIYFADVATGAYALFFVWMVVIAASFFSDRAIAAHLAWIIIASGIALSTVDEPSEISLLSRWVIGSLMLIVATGVMSQIVAGRREAEAELRHKVEENEKLRLRLEHLAHHDPLTGLPNRRLLAQELARELARARRSRSPLCVVQLDLDGLKAYNDTHGHVAGDRLLKQAASAWSAALRASDLIARMGGDEFLVLLPDCPQIEAASVVERLRDGFPGGHSFSAGIACWDGSESEEQLLMRADREMYAVKAR